MTNLLIRLFVPNSDKISEAPVRARYGTLSGLVGIVCNTALFALKLIFGFLVNSVAVTADAFNNLSDVGSALVTLIGFKMASKPADKEHPYGHGRIEYVSGLIVCALILLVGLEFVKTSIGKILNPEPVEFQIIVVVGLVASILVKLWMSAFNRTVGRRIHSAALEATSMDSITDVLATAVTLIAVVAARFTDLPIDGYMGLVVALLILVAGVKIAGETLSPLLGRAPDAELVRNIKDMAMSFDGILGVHDIRVHDYGPGRIFASMHAEVSVSVHMMESHALIDRVELAMEEALGIEITIHMDPLDTESEITNTLREVVARVAHEVCEEFTIHDFIVVESGTQLNLVFDVRVPIEDKRSNSEMKELLEDKIRALNENYVPKIVVDRL
ncbi:MAG: cation diffusion facilitator family transporter [Clostridia bacterium]